MNTSALLATPDRRRMTMRPTGEFPRPQTRQHHNFPHSYNLPARVRRLEVIAVVVSLLLVGHVITSSMFAVRETSPKVRFTRTPRTESSNGDGGGGVGSSGATSTSTSKTTTTNAMKYAAVTSKAAAAAFGMSASDGSSEPNIHPNQSTPPKAIPLYEVAHPGIRKRHECIDHIRQQHVKLLNGLVNNKISALLVDPAYHANVGDHMITLGEKTFISVPLTECHLVQAGHYVQNCKQVYDQALSSPETKVAVWHGGGNWGDLWRDAQDARLESFPALLQSNHSIVSMPQSLYYRDEALEARDADKMKNMFQSLDDPQRVVFTWRERESYDKAVELYPFVQNILVPDIAFQLGPFKPIPPKEPAFQFDIIMFLRDDIESKYQAKRNKEYIQRTLSKIEGGEKVTFRIVDWKDRLQIFHSRDKFFTDTAIQMLSMGKVVVCDRLHAAILCYLAGIPFVFIDQVTGKISKTLRVAFETWEGCTDGETAMWARATSLSNALSLATGFIQLYNLSSTVK